MSYYITEQKANFICDCGYEKNGITTKAAETVRRLHEKVCPNQKIKVRLTEKPKGFGAADLPSMYEFRADRYGRDYRNDVRRAINYEKERWCGWDI